MKNAARWVGSISPASVLSYTESDALNVFTSGNAAFMRHWSSALRGISEATRTGTVGVAPLPAGPAGRSHTVGGFHLAVSRYSAQPSAAAALVLYLTGIEVQTRRALKRGYIPTYPQLYPQPDLIRALPQSRVLQEISAGGWIATRPSKEAGSQYAEVSKAYYESVHQILAGRVRAEPALAALEEKLSDLIGVQKDVSGLKNGP
jgi:trehalose/maltose transport system substrate-binding protein